MFHGIIFNSMKTLITEEYNASIKWQVSMDILYRSSSILLFCLVGAAAVKTLTGRNFYFAKKGAYLLKQ